MSTLYASVPNPTDSQLSKGYGNSHTAVSDFAHGNPSLSSPLAQQQQYDVDDSQRGGSSVQGTEDGHVGGLGRSASSATTAVPTSAPPRSNTLKKKGSVRRAGSLRRSSSRRSLAAAGSIKSVGGVDTRSDDFNSVFYTPIPTQGSPTEVLANRFQAWRQLLKSLIAYFREIQDSYDMRAKALRKVQNTVANIVNPSVFMSENGLGDATRILDDYHKRSIAEANKSRDIENDVIGALTGLRSDLGQKIKEIKSLSGDFKNSVDKEKEGTKREVEKLSEALQLAEREDGSATGKNDPFVVRLGVDRMVERQIDEENYLHRAYLNLESSGRELESIVVGEIQKAYNALAGILKREADDAYTVVENLRTGPIAMPKDQEWMQFVVNDPHFVDPGVPLRRIEDIEYPGKHHPAAAEIRAGMLERKSKYLKSYTPGWYVLSPTHLHEFKSADKIYTQPPVMSLYLPEQKLGSKSEPGSSSHKFMLKGRQSGGGMHKGHNWVFRAETHDTMLAWYEDIRNLTETTGAARTAYVRKHARSVSAMSDRGTVSSDGMEDDEADAEPYRADLASLAEQNPAPVGDIPYRPQPGGRFPSDLQVPRIAPLSPSSGSSEPDRDTVAAAGLLRGSVQQEYAPNGNDPYRLDGISAGERTNSAYSPGPSTTEYSYDDSILAPVATYERPKTYQPTGQQQQAQLVDAVNNQQLPQQSFLGDERDLADPAPGPLDRHNSTYDDWMAPPAAGVAGAGPGVAEAESWREQRERAAKEAAASTTAAAAVVPPPLPIAKYDVPDLESATAIAVNHDTGMDKLSAVSNGAYAAPAAISTSTSTTGADKGTVLGGLESEGARTTGTFPTVVRHNTELSVSALHVPGEYPNKV